MKFAHIADCHLGGWPQPQLRELNFKCFQEAVKRCIGEKVDFILIAGDLFDAPYPPIDTLKETFDEFRKIKEAKIPVFLIAGSHDYSVSGKTFLDVLEKAGFCKNVFDFEEHNGKIILHPTLYNGAAIYGYPGKKSGLEVAEIRKIKLQEAPGLFRIVMLHTSIRSAVPYGDIEAVDEKELPSADYYALGHLHIRYQKNEKVYPGPTFPNNIGELEELQGGSFCIVDKGKIRREIIKIKEVLPIYLEINNALRATEDVVTLLKKENLKDKIIIIRLLGTLETGKISDIDFQRIEQFAREHGALTVLKSTNKLYIEEFEKENSQSESENIESEIVDGFIKKNQNKFSGLIPELLKTFMMEKIEDETALTFEDRLFSEARNLLAPHKIGL